MSAATVTQLKKKTPKIDTITLTPEMATELLEHNQLNRPLSDQHVQRIARQIIGGKWHFNGDTIKIADTGDVLDGQHRLWAVIEAKLPIDTIVVRGIKKDAFSTIDTLRRPRAGGDVIALAGTRRYRTVIAASLSWLLRWQRGVLENYRAPQNRIENSDIEEAFAAHPGIARAAEKAMKLRGLVSPSLMAFIYYITANREEDLANSLIDILHSPAGVSLNHPFYRLRTWISADLERKRDSVTIIALTFKALNAAHQGKEIAQLSWRSQGANPERFPTLEI